MAIYPQALSKISEASSRVSAVHEGQNLRDWAKSKAEYLDKYIVAINIPNNGAGDGTNEIIPAYDFIEKVADAVVLDDQELFDALSDTAVNTIFLGKDIKVLDNVTLSNSKVIVAINAILDLNNKEITIGTNNLDVYCKTKGKGTINGTGTIWFKDIITHNNPNPITAANATRTYERCIEDDYVTYHELAGWTQAFKDNTFPWNNILKKIKDEEDRAKAAEANLAQAITDEETRATGEEARLEGKVDDETDRATGEEARIESKVDDETDRATAAESALGDRITAETDRATAAENDLRSDVNHLDGGSLGEYVYGISKNASGELSRLSKSVDTTVSTKTSEDYAVPTVKAVKDYVDGIANRVYKPKGNKTVADIQAYTPAASNLGEVYNIIGITTRTTINLTDSAGAAYTIEVEPEEDVGCVNVGTDVAPVYRWNDFGGKIDLSNYYTKSEVDTKTAAATTSITNNGNNTTVSNTTAADNSKVYTINSEKTTVSVVANHGLKTPTASRNASTYTTNYEFDLDLANADDVTACVALFNNL